MSRRPPGSRRGSRSSGISRRPRSTRALIGAVRDAARAQGYRHQDIVSGAGHDAVYMARVAPTAMVFVPCAGGISHNEIEDASADDLAAGCSVLMNALLETADMPTPGIA